jgi:hypothetical protein
MSQRGRKSAASLSVAPVALEQRLPPQAGLTPAQKAVWVSVVNCRPADWFSDAHSGLLAQYCRHKVQSDIVAGQLEEFDPDWLADDEGLKRFDKLGAMLERETRSMNTLMRAMRITQQSLLRADKSVSVSRAKKPWQSDD